jgi:hypothetical protein
MADKYIFVKRVIVRDEYYIVKVNDAVVNDTDGKGSILDRVMESNYCYDTEPFDTDIHTDEFEVDTKVPTDEEIAHAKKYSDFLDLTEEDD